MEPKNGTRRKVPSTDLAMEVAMEVALEPESRASEQSLSPISPWSLRMEPEMTPRAEVAMELENEACRGKLNGGLSQ